MSPQELVTDFVLAMHEWETTAFARDRLFEPRLREIFGAFATSGWSQVRPQVGFLRKGYRRPPDYYPSEHLQILRARESPPWVFVYTAGRPNTAVLEQRYALVQADGGWRIHAKHLRNEDGLVWAEDL